MAHFAKLNEDNIVEQVIVVHNEDAPNETAGLSFLESVKLEGNWKQTSYNTFAGKHTLGGVAFRKNFAAVGYTYDEQRDAFIMPSPHASWILNEETCIWEPPIPKPEVTALINWNWNEETLSWDVVNLPL
jgi:hypothetical protein